MVTMEKIINYLKSKPNCMAEYQDVKGQFDEEQQNYLKRLFKSQFFHKFLITDTVSILFNNWATCNIMNIF